MAEFGITETEFSFAAVIRFYRSWEIYLWRA